MHTDPLQADSDPAIPKFTHVLCSLKFIIVFTTAHHWTRSSGSRFWCLHL